MNYERTQLIEKDPNEESLKLAHELMNEHGIPGAVEICRLIILECQKQSSARIAETNDRLAEEKKQMDHVVEIIMRLQDDIKIPQRP